MATVVNDFLLDSFLLSFFLLFFSSSIRSVHVWSSRGLGRVIAGNGGMPWLYSVWGYYLEAFVLEASEALGIDDCRCRDGSDTGFCFFFACPSYIDTGLGHVYNFKQSLKRTAVRHIL